MPVTTITHESTQPQADPNAVYLVDFSKIESVQSLILILASIGFSFSPKHPHFDKIKEFLNLENPIYPNQPITPSVKNEKDIIELPKLKPIRPNGE